MLLHGLVLQPPHPSNLRHQPGRAARPHLQPLVTRTALCIVCLLCDFWLDQISSPCCKAMRYISALSLVNDRHGRHQFFCQFTTFWYVVSQCKGTAMFGLGCVNLAVFVLSCFMLIKLEDLFKAILYSLVYVRKFVNRLMFAQTSRHLLHLLLPKLGSYSQWSFHWLHFIMCYFRCQR